MADSTSTILIKLMPERSDTILDISTVHLYKSFQSCFFFFKETPKNFQSPGETWGFGWCFSLLKSLCPNSGVWAEPSWFPFRDSGWLRPVIRRRGNKLLSVSPRGQFISCYFALPFFFLRVSSFQLFETLLRAITSGLSGGVKGGVGWLLGSLVGRKHVASKHTHHTLRSKYCEYTSVMAAHLSRHSSGDLSLTARMRLLCQRHQY